MKKFYFPLDTVLNYKDQVLDNLKNEHAQILYSVTQQEILIESLTEQRRAACDKIKEDTKAGLTINTMREYEKYITHLQQRIVAEQVILKKLKRKEEQKRAQVVEARKETASIEKLKEKKLLLYNKEVQRSEELFIEEFVSNTMSVHRNR